MTTPRPISDGALWTRADFPETRSWVQPLSPGMSAELKTAVAKAMAAGGSPYDLTPDTFDLPAMRPLLAETRHQLEEGRGFAVIGDFPVDDFSYDESLWAYCGLSSYLGEITAQGRSGDRSVDAFLNLPTAEPTLAATRSLLIGSVLGLVLAWKAMIA